MLGIADGRYVVREDGQETVLAIETHGVPAPPRRRRRRAREADGKAFPATVPLTRVTVIEAARSFVDEGEAQRWLENVGADESSLDALLAESAAVLSHALHVHAVVSEDPLPPPVSPESAAAVRVGFGSGEQVADGEWTGAVEVDAGPARSRRRQHADELRPQARTAAVLGGRERLDACETLLLRARADLDAGRAREAALQLRVGIEALLAELVDAVDDPAHQEDMAILESRRGDVRAASEAATRGDLDPAQRETLEDLTAICERVLRRRRVLKD